MKPQKETRQERFVRLAEARTNKLLDNIRLLENLSSSIYDYSADWIDQIFTAIRIRLDRAEHTLRSNLTEGPKKRFSLSEPYFTNEELIAMGAPHWVTDPLGGYYCSQCGTVGKGDAPDEQDRHCRYCGARMTGAVLYQGKSPAFNLVWPSND